MRKYRLLLLSYALTFYLVGCSTIPACDSGTESGTAIFEIDPAPATTQEKAESFTSISGSTQVTDFVPTKTDVLNARALTLEGMAPEQVEKLTTVVREANMWWEHNYLYLDIFGLLADPNSLYWNLFDQTGSVQIGWQIPGNLDMATVCEEENLTENEFYAKYGIEFLVHHEHDANDFVAILDELIATVQNEDLKTDLQYVRDEAWLAKENHSMEHANNEYKALHDLDYFLLRYGPVDVGQYVTDDSTVSKYYGTLSIYS